MNTRSNQNFGCVFRSIGYLKINWINHKLTETNEKLDIVQNTIFVKCLPFIMCVIILGIGGQYDKQLGSTFWSLSRLWAPFKLVHVVLFGYFNLFMHCLVSNITVWINTYISCCRIFKQRLGLGNVDAMVITFYYRYPIDVCSMISVVWEHILCRKSTQILYLHISHIEAPAPRVCTT